MAWLRILWARWELWRRGLQLEAKKRELEGKRIDALSLLIQAKTEAVKTHAVRLEAMAKALHDKTVTAEDELRVEIEKNLKERAALRGLHRRNLPP